MTTLAGHVAIISGGLGDIGRAIARELAARGADIALGGLQSSEAAEPTLAEVRTMGRRARFDPVDVAVAAATAAWVRRVEAELGVPTLIVPNAAQVTTTTCREMTPAAWSRELRVNLDGAFHLAQSAAQRLIALGRPGRIVFIGSWAGHRVHPHIPAYSVSKAGLRMLTQCMALEFAPHDILVNEVAPGIVDAGLSGRMMQVDPALRDGLRALVPVNRLIEPSEVAGAVAFLCEPANRQMAGSVLLLDGGMSLLPPRP